MSLTKYKIIGRLPGNFSVGQEIEDRFFAYKKIPYLLGYCGTLVLEIEVKKHMPYKTTKERGIIKKIWTLKSFMKHHPLFYEMCKRKIKKVYLETLFEKDENKLISNLKKDYDCVFYMSKFFLYVLTLEDSFFRWIWIKKQDRKNMLLRVQQTCR